MKETAMKSTERKTLILVLIAGCLFACGSGCRQEAAPEARQARLIAAESIQLREQLAERDAEMEKLKSRHAHEIERKQQQLAACQKRVESLEKDLQSGIAQRVNSVMATVMAENARLRNELGTLRAEIERLKSQP
jgi:TolA-binding protein